MPLSLEIPRCSLYCSYTFNFCLFSGDSVPFSCVFFPGTFPFSICIQSGNQTRRLYVHILGYIPFLKCLRFGIPLVPDRLAFATTMIAKKVTNFCQFPEFVKFLHVIFYKRNLLSAKILQIIICVANCVAIEYTILRNSKEKIHAI